ncbi:MAG: hypothetical protein QXS20_05525 [Candidatus Thorarchaeota archaeon]
MLILDMFFGGLKVFFKTKRYVAYLTIFVATTVLSLFLSAAMTMYASTYGPVLVQFFIYAGATGTIYFAIGVVLTSVGLDNLWITHRGRGRVTELKGLAWMAVSFAIAVYLSIALGQGPLLFFSMFGWVGWIAFQAYLSTRTSLRLATIAEPKKGSIMIGLGSFLILLVGLGIIAALVLAALVLIPQNVFGLGDMVTSILPSAINNLNEYYSLLVVAMGLIVLFGVISLLSFFRYAARGASLNISLLTLFVSVYSGYFLFNIMRRTGAPRIEPVDIAIALFFLAYAMSGIGRTLTESVEESRRRLRDLGPLMTFFLASGFFYVDSVIAVSATTGLLSHWTFLDYSTTVSFETFLFRDIAKLIAFPITAILTSFYYLKFQRAERVIERAKAEGVTLHPEDVDKDLAREVPPAGQPYPSETVEGIKKGKQGHELSTPDSKRLVVDSSRRLGKVKRLGEDEEKDK